jgi:hypothetical protein
MKGNLSVATSMLKACMAEAGYPNTVVINLYNKVYISVIYAEIDMYTPEWGAYVDATVKAKKLVVNHLGYNCVIA